MIAISENLSKPCTTEVYSGGTSKEDLIEAYIKLLKDFGKCELQRRESYKLSLKLKELYEN